jgi:hypothetical protein
MQAIRTRYHSPTNTRGTRITASCESGSLTLPRDYSLNIDQDYARVAQRLVERLGWTGVYFGGEFGGDYYWVCESGWPPTVKVANTQEAA